MPVFSNHGEGKRRPLIPALVRIPERQRKVVAAEKEHIADRPEGLCCRRTDLGIGVADEAKKYLLSLSNSQNFRLGQTRKQLRGDVWGGR
jgi:hypothetical protein